MRLRTERFQDAREQEQKENSADILTENEPFEQCH